MEYAGKESSQEGKFGTWYAKENVQNLEHSNV